MSAVAPRGSVDRVGPAAAYFDVDGTLLRSNIVEYLVFFQRRRLPAWRACRWTAGLALQVPLFIVLDHRDRAAFCRSFYRLYDSLPVSELQALAQPLFEEVLRPRLRQQALHTVEQHRAQGDRVVLLTGSLDFIVAPLAAHLGAQEVISASLETEGGRFTGRLRTPPLTNHGKAVAVREHTARHGIAATDCYAYGDSISDLPMLESVGHPQTVTPDRRLRAVARERGWPIHEWAPG